MRMSLMLKDSIHALGGAQTCQDVTRIIERVAKSEVDMAEALDLMGQHYPDVPLPALATNLEQLGLAVLVHRYPSQEGLYQQLCASARPLKSILEAAASNEGLSSEDCKTALARLVKHELDIQDEGEQEEEQSKEEEEDDRSSKKRTAEEDEQDEDESTKRAKDDFDAANFLAEIKPMIHLPLAHHPMVQPIAKEEGETLLAAFVRAHLPGQGLSILVRSFCNPLAEGAYIKLALALGRNWSEIGATLGIRAKEPATTGRVQLAQFLYDLIVTHHLHRLRYLQPADRHVVPRFKGHIRPIKAHLERGMSAEEKAWWRNGVEQVPMLSTRNARGEEVSYVDPTWLLQ